MENYQEYVDHLKVDLFIALTAQAGIRKLEEPDRRLRVMLMNDGKVLQEVKHIVQVETIRRIGD